MASTSSTSAARIHWRSCKPVGQIPSSRSGAAMASVGTRAYVFGGVAGGENMQCYGDMFCIDLASEPPEWKQVEMTGTVPSPREGHTLNVVDGLLYLYGGSGTSDASSCLKGMYTFDPITNVWKQLETSGDGPKALNLTAVVIDSAIYTFGGIVDGEGTSDLHVFDTASKRWSLLSASGRAPEPRGDHCATTAGRKMYIFGGSGGEDVFFNDLYVLDISSLMWTEIYPNGRSPAVREFATLCGYGEEMLILFGGTAATTYSEIDYNDIHAFDLQSNEWQGPAVTGPIPEKRYSHCSVTWRDQMIVFGGLNSNQDFNDLCILHLPQLELSSDETASAAVFYTPTAPVKAQYDLTTPVPAKRKTVPVAPSKTVRPRDFDELKTTLLQRVTEMFDELANKFFQLDKEQEQLRAEREAFEEERRSHNDLYERQQQELKEMFELHKQQNEEWIQLRKEENDKERKFVAEEKARWEEKHEQLAKEREVFDQKASKMEMIMKQFQGIQ